ncbi:hypothetical protein PFISCL1PPCAC_5795, partial [Pristionchus fissidentatus]
LCFFNSCHQSFCALPSHLSLKKYIFLQSSRIRSSSPSIRCHFVLPIASGRGGSCQMASDNSLSIFL